MALTGSKSFECYLKAEPSTTSSPVTATEAVWHFHYPTYVWKLHQVNIPGRTSPPTKHFARKGCGCTGHWKTKCWSNDTSKLQMTELTKKPGTILTSEDMEDAGSPVQSMLEMTITSLVMNSVLLGRLSKYPPRPKDLLPIELWVMSLLDLVE